MEKVKLEVEVPKELHELAEGVSVFLVEVMNEIKSHGGWTVGDDLPNLAVAAMALVPALNGFLAVGAELKDDLSGCISAITIAMAKVLDAAKA